MISRSVTAWVALLCCFAGGMVLLYVTRAARRDHDMVQPVDQTESADRPVSGGEDFDFELTDQQGRTFDSRQLDGKIWVGSIFFANCPSTCRVQNQRIAELQREFGPRGVHFVSITCDPKHDTPKQLADYSRVFTSEPQTWHFLTGDLDLIKRIGNHRLGIAVDEQVHSDRLVIFDRDGNLVGTYSTTKRDELLKAQQALEDLLASV